MLRLGEHWVVGQWCRIRAFPSAIWPCRKAIKDGYAKFLPRRPLRPHGQPAEAGSGAQPGQPSPPPTRARSLRPEAGGVVKSTGDRGSVVSLCGRRGFTIPQSWTQRERRGRLYRDGPDAVHHCEAWSCREARCPVVLDISARRPHCSPDVLGHVFPGRTSGNCRITFSPDETRP